MRPLSPRAWLGAARAGVPDRSTLRQEAIAALPSAISSIPDGMASGVLVGVSPVHGIYASMAGPIAGGLTSSTRLMVVTTTSAAALAAGSALSGVAPEDKPGALTLLTVIAGLAMVLAGIARFGRYTRFVSHSVMTGFLTGVSVNIVFGQIPDLLGTKGSGSFNLAKALDVLTHPSRIDQASMWTGFAAIALVVGLGRTKLASIGSLAALVLPTLGAIVFGLDSVLRLRDGGDIPSGLPVPALPDFGAFGFDTLTGALAVAAIVLVQGAGVAQSAANPDGSQSDPNRDFISQGAGNIAASLVRGQPVGGSVGATALNVASGGRTRWAGVLSGVWIVVIMLAFSSAIGVVAQPTLAALLICAGIASLQPGRAITILRTGATSQIAFVTTFLATLFLPVAAAVGIGVSLSLLLQLNREALDLRIVELVPQDGGFREKAAPLTLQDDSVTMLDVYGSLLYAGSRTLQVRLPNPADVVRAAVVIRLRGRTQLGATFFSVIDDYAARLATGGGRLFLSGVDPSLLAQFERVGGASPSRISAVVATEVIGESSSAAYERAVAWLGSVRPADDSPAADDERLPDEQEPSPA